MTKEEFIKKLSIELFEKIESVLLRCYNKERSETDTMTDLLPLIEEAIAEHEAGKWMPYPENIPKSVEKKYIITTIGGVFVKKYYEHQWKNIGTIAFRELPTPYKQEGGEG